MPRELVLVLEEGRSGLERVAVLVSAVTPSFCVEASVRTVKGKQGDLCSSGEVEWLHYTTF